MWEIYLNRIRRKLGSMRNRPEQIFLIAVAVIGYILLVRDADKEIGALGLIAIVGAIIGLLFVISRLYRPDHVGPPPDDSEGPVSLLRNPVEHDRKPYVVRFPTTTASANDVIQKSQEVFGGDAIDPEEDMKAFFADPYSLICLEDARGNVVGFTDYYAFDKPRFQLFVTGHDTFDELLAGGLLQHPQARKAKVVYLATILNYGYQLEALAAERRRQNGILVWATVENLLTYHVIPESGVDIYSIGWHRKGNAILEMFKFQQVGRVMRGSSEGKWIYARYGVTRPELETIQARYRRRHELWCDLKIFPAAPVTPE